MQCDRWDSNPRGTCTTNTRDRPLRHGHRASGGIRTRADGQVWSNALPCRGMRFPNPQAFAVQARSRCIRKPLACRPPLLGPLCPILSYRRLISVQLSRLPRTRRATSRLKIPNIVGTLRQPMLGPGLPGVGGFPNSISSPLLDVPLLGLEPRTRRLKAAYSTRLSYRGLRSSTGNRTPATTLPRSRSTTDLCWHKRFPDG